MTAPSAPTIAFVSPMAELGGSDYALLRIVRALEGSGSTVHVVLPGVSPLGDAFERAGAHLQVVPMRRITSAAGAGWWVRYALEWPGSVLRLRRLIRQQGVDVLVTNSLHSWYGWAAAALTRRPHAWHAREIVVQSQLALRVERLLVRTARIVVACSRAVADQLDDVVPPDRLVVVHEDVDRTEFTPARAGRFRATVGIPSEVPLVGFVGRVDTWKGLDVLLAAWPDVRARRPDAHLVVVGGPVLGKEGYYRELERRASTLDGVTWVGPVPAAADVMADLDVFAAPSTSPEPYGLVLVEALASGAPVVSTAAGGPPEILARAGAGAGRLVPPADPAALAAALADVLAERPGGRSAPRAPLIDPFPYDWAALYQGASLVDSPPMSARDPVRPASRPGRSG